MSKLNSIFRAWRLLSVCVGFLSFAALALAQDAKIEARLIWGTDIETNINCKIEDPHLSAELSRIFKWKNYYQITNCATSIPVNETRPLEMSSKCLIKVKNLGETRVEVSCFGSGKLVSKAVYLLPPDKWLTLGGADLNDSAWFIVLHSKHTKDSAKPAATAVAK